jgi:hypothetical protein
MTADRKSTPQTLGGVSTGSLVVEIPAPVADLLDRITILRIKATRVEGAALEHVQRELVLLEARWTFGEVPEAKRLEAVNQELWDVEDALRYYEAQTDFGERFVELARSIYRLNDERAKLKRMVNERLGSCLVEVKAYTAS